MMVQIVEQLHPHECHRKRFLGNGCDDGPSLDGVQSFGIGVIQLDLDNPDDCSILLAPRKNSDIDWQTVDRIAAVNPDFAGFINSVAKSVKINHPTVVGFDKVLDDADLGVYLKKIQGK